MRNASELVNSAWNIGLTPPPELTVSEWAEKNRILPKSSPAPGPYRHDRTPYMREIVDSLSSLSPTREVDFEKGTQIGGTEGGLNWTGYIVDNFLGNLMIVLPSMDVAKEWSQQRLAHLVESTPSLDGKIEQTRKRDGGNAVFSKRFGGCYIKFAWPTSSKRLRSTPAPFILGDEVDDWKGDVDGEGDPVTILRRRFANFDRGKFFRVSSPKLGNNSRIHRGFEEGDQRFFFLPCPACGHFQRLTVEGLYWEPRKPETARYRCLKCVAGIEERFKPRMLAGGVWVATKGEPELCRDGFSSVEQVQGIRSKMATAIHASFHLSAMYSPYGWYSWGSSHKESVASDFEKAQESEVLMKNFVMTVKGEPYHQPGEAPDWKRLFDRRDGSYALGEVPAGALTLTAGADVQKDRIEVYVYGWGKRDQCWLVDQIILYGDVRRNEVWEDLTRTLGTVYLHVSGAELTIRKLAIDCNYETSVVFTWARRHTYGPVVLVRGGSDSSATIISAAVAADLTIRGRKSPAGVRFHNINTSELKRDLYSRLSLDTPNIERGEAYPDRFFHFCPLPDTEEYLKQLTAEQLLATGKWDPNPRHRNEATDCWVYAKAAAILERLDRRREAEWDAIERRMTGSLPVTEESGPVSPGAVVGRASETAPASTHQGFQPGAIYNDNPWL